MPSTMPLTSVLPSLVFVWPSNCGWGIFTEMTAVIPSRMSSPEILSVSFSARLFLDANELIVRVSADRKPDRCVPPSVVLMLLAKLYVVSV
jgi:hypothetical protein